MPKYEQETQAIQSFRPSIADTSFLHTVSSGAWVPLARAAISGFLVAMLLVSIIWPIWGLERCYIALVLGLGVTLLTWWLFQRKHSRLQSLIEKLLNADLNNSGAKGDYKPSARDPQEITVNVRERSSDGVDQIMRTRVRISPYALQMLAEGVIIQGKDMTEKNWVASGIFGDTEYSTIKKELQDARFLVPKNPKHINLGYTWTAAGRAFLKHYAPPPPDLPDGYQQVPGRS